MSLTSYTKWDYLLPPRPEKAVPPSSLDFYEKNGWAGQIKKNGSCTVLGISPEKIIHSWNRHSEEHRAWKADWKNPAMLPFLELPEKWFVFEPELLHNKVKDLRDTLYLFDILVADSEFLLGTTWPERQALIHSLFPNTIPGGLGYILVPGSNLWIAEPIHEFRKVFDSLDQDEDEGIVLKDQSAKMTFCLRESSNSFWQVKCRKSKKNICF